jgi:hypothetical protein
MRHITKTPAPQAEIKAIFSGLDLSQISYFISPLTYDATDWLCARRANPRIKGGWLSNELSAWTLLLWMLRDRPRRLSTAPLAGSFSQDEYDAMLSQYNLLAKRFVASRDEEERGVTDQEDVELFVKNFYALTQLCDMTNGLRNVGLELRNEMNPQAEAKVRAPELAKASKLLSGTHLADLDPISFIWRARNEGEGSFCQADTLWSVIPAPQDQDLMWSFHLDHAPSLLASGARIITIAPEDPDVLEAYGTAVGNTWGAVRCVKTETEGLVLITNLPTAT